MPRLGGAGVAGRTDPAAGGEPPLKRPRGWTLCLVSLAATAALLAHAWLYRNNTLLENGRWESGKTTLSLGVMGAVAYQATHIALSRNRLDLGAWHGYQELLYREPLDIAEIAFDFRLAPGAYLVFEHHRDEEQGFAGVRWSANPSYPPALFAATIDGRFTSRTPLAQPSAVSDGGWHRARVAFRDEADGRFDVSVDGWPVIASGTATPALAQRIGFRAGLEPAYVDNVEIRRRGGDVIREDFANTRGWPRVLAVALASLLVLDLLLYRWRGAGAVVYANVLLFVFALSLHALDWFHFSGLHPRVIPGSERFTNTIEDRKSVLARLAAASDAPSATRRILFIGSSQTWGAGARRPADTFVARIQAALDREVPSDDGGGPFECINSGISGERAPALVELYRRRWLPHLRPELVVVDLGNNDEDQGRFRQALDELAEINAARGVATLFVLEPNSPETRGSPTFHLGPGTQRAAGAATLARKHAAMREVAARHRLPVVDLAGHLDAHRDDGFVWWDFVHLTSYGHELAAERLLEAIRPLLREAKRP